MLTGFKLEAEINQTVNGRLSVVGTLIRRDKAFTPGSIKMNFLLQVTPPGRARQEFQLRHLHHWSNFQKRQTTQGTQSNP